MDWTDARRLTDCDLWFVWAGQGRMRLTEGKVIDLHPGVCFWMRPGRTYQATHDPADPLGVTFIHFDLWRSARKKVPIPMMPPERHEVRDFLFVDTVLRRIVELLRSPDAASAANSRRFEAGSLLISVLASLDRSAGEGRADHASPSTVANQRKLAEVISLIAEAPGKVPPVRELARKWGWSAAHFSRLFRETTGESPQAFIIKTRLQRARQLLRESSLTISEIAAMLGYPDVFFFSRQFKARTGQSPTEFRGGR